MPAGYGLSRSAKPAKSLLSTFNKGKKGTSNQDALQLPRPAAAKKQFKIPDDFAPPASTDEEDEEEAEDHEDTETSPTAELAAPSSAPQPDLLASSSGDEGAVRGAIHKTSWKSNRKTRSTRNDDISDHNGSTSSSAQNKRRQQDEPIKPKRQKITQLEDIERRSTKSSQDIPTSSSSQSTSAFLFGRRHAPAQTFGKKGAEPRRSRILQPKRSQWQQNKEGDDVLPSDSEDGIPKKPLKNAGDSPGTPDPAEKKQPQKGLQVVDDIDDDLFDSPRKKPGKLKVRQRAGTEELLATPPKKALQESTSNNTRGLSRLKMKGKRKIKSPTPDHEPPRPRFKAPALIDEEFEAGNTFTHKDDLAPWSSDAENSDAKERLSPVPEVPPGPISAKCPWCSEPVAASLLADYSKGKKRLTVNLQRKFCQIHKKATALQTWETRGYPQIAWDILPPRLDDHLDHLMSIINGEQPSSFRSVLAKQIEEGKSRALRQEDNLNPGYYGPRGFQLMCDYLVDKFREHLKERAVIDPVIRGRGSAAFIQSVLLPELGVRLIMEDMSLDEEAARHVLEESKSLGEIVSEEV